MSIWTGHACLQGRRDVTQLRYPLRDRTQGSPESLPFGRGCVPAGRKPLLPGLELAAAEPGTSTPVPALQLRKGRCHAGRRVSHVAKRLLRGLKGLFAQPVRSTRKRERMGHCPPTMLRCSTAPPGTTAGTCTEGLRPPLGCSLPHKATLWESSEQGFARYLTEVSCKGQRSGREGSHSLVQAVRWLCHRSSFSLGMLQDRQSQRPAATAFQSPLHKLATE